MYAYNLFKKFYLLYITVILPFISHLDIELSINIYFVQIIQEMQHICIGNMIKIQIIQYIICNIYIISKLVLGYQQCIILIIYMYGGHLNLNSISLLNNHLIATFGNSFYLFNTSTQLCTAIIDVGHQQNIVSFNVLEQKNNYSVHSIDSKGIFIKSTFILLTQQIEQVYQGGIQYKIVSKKQISKKQKYQIVSYAFVSHNDFVFVDNNKKLNHYNALQNANNVLAYEHSFSKVLANNRDEYIYAIEENQNVVRVFSKQNYSFVKEYTQNAKITSAISIGQLLIVGDEKGKITLLYDYFNQGKGKKNKIQSVLEWHTGPVHALCSNGQYIYSAGEESTVVLWHVRDLSRDFLPRVRLAIKYLQVKADTNQIICGLSDNTIKIIDLSRDKETHTYKTVVNPKGYIPTKQPAFSIQRVHYRYGIVCLNGLPGRLQFINLFKNGENTELEIVPRNLINSINEDRMEPHEINSFAFSQDSSILAVDIQVSQNKSYLKFYRKNIQGFDLVSKIENPHSGKINACMAIDSHQHSKFITYCTTDKIVRVWSPHTQKKKSIVDTQQLFWRCQQQLKFRNFYPTYFNVHLNHILAIYHSSQIIIYQVQQNGNIKQVQHFSLSNINQAHILQYSKNKTKINIKLLLKRNLNDIEIWTFQQNSNQALKITNNQKLHIKQQISNYFVCNDKDQACMVIVYGTKSQLLILNKKESKFTQGYDSDSIIQTAFWMEKRIIVVGADLTMTALDGKQFLTFQSGISGDTAQMQEQTTQIRMDSESDLFKLNERWVSRQSAKSKKKIEDSIQGLHLLPSCLYAWQQMATRILI